MGTRIGGSVALGVVVGLVIGLWLGPYPGVGAGVAVAVVGVVLGTLRRNAADRRALERGRVPEAVDRALGEEPPP